MKGNRDVVVADDAAEYSGALAGFDLDVIRTGVGFGPNIVRNSNLSGFGLSSGAVQFPVLGRATIPDDRIVAVLVSAAPRGSRWCEIDLAPGTVLAYGPGTEHMAISPVGLVYTLATIDLSRLEEATEWTGTPIERPARGHVVKLQPTRNVRPLMAMLQSVADPRVPRAAPQIARSNVLHAVARAFAGDPPVRWPGAGRRLDSRRVVNVCIEYADTLGRSPAIPELCVVSHVSERRLRSAFVDTFDLPPVRYFRYRSLNLARRRLTGAVDEATTVTNVAFDLGFTHLSRFARLYRTAFGELPSETLSSRS